MASRKSEKRTYLDVILREYGFENDFKDTDELPDAVRKVREAFESDQYRALYDLSFRDAEPWFSPSLAYMHKVASAFLANLTHTPDLEILRHKVKMDYGQDLNPLVRGVPFIPGSDCISRQWVILVWERLLNEFRTDIMDFDGTVELYLASRSGDIHSPGRIFFHLVESRTPPAETEPQDEYDDDEVQVEYPFAFLATYSPDPGPDGKPLPHVPLKFALQEYKDDSRKMLGLLSHLNKVADRSELISGLMESGELFHPLAFTEKEAFDFLKEVDMYEECGILCRIPNWWRHRQQTSMELKINPDGMMSITSLLQCVPELVVDGVEMTEEEVRELLERTEGLAMLKGRWVNVNHAKLKSLLKTYDDFKEKYGEGISFMDAFRLSAGMNEETEEIAGISNSDWLSRFMDNTSRHADEFSLSDGFHGSLRSYQDKGVRWLSQLSDLGFGACLADDMGLGKTAQMLAFIISKRKERDHALLVVPASLIGNWQREITKFTPDLGYCVVSSSKDPLLDEPLTITTYGMIARNEKFTYPDWDMIILDEAQAIKNPTSKQSKAVRALKGRFKVAMTGTPVENGLQDLWSLFDFTNPGLLGDRSEFDLFVGRMEHSGSYGKLRNMTAPFILRRMKTDKSIISDLPDKLETNEIITLSKKQRVLYKKTLDDFETRIKNCPPGGRLGLVLSAITKFKQICNHPSQFLGQSDFTEADSGKFAMLRELCEAISEKREKVLIFTQYKEMTAPISDFLTEVFGRKGLVFHGGMTKKARNDAVEMFNSEKEYIPYMVISLKAGGTGLNLTTANHVIHFDRWWNPAVENQATDRAFRIGQTKDVLVHKFVCKGTLEERIDDMINSKVELAENVIGSGESWISEMDDKELLDIFRLE